MTSSYQQPARGFVCALLTLTAALAGAATLTAAGETDAHVRALVAAGVAASVPAAEVDPAQRRYERDRAACLSGRTAQDQPTCLREAEAARDEARRGGLTSDDAHRQRNQMARCDPLPADQRDACRARMAGEGSTSGSVDGGGIIRERVTREVLPAPVPPTGSASSPTPPAR